LPLPQIELAIHRLEPLVALTALVIALVTAIRAIRPARAGDLSRPEVVSSALVLPFILLELVNRQAFHEPFPVPHFAILWLVPVSFTLILTPVVRMLRRREPTGARALSTTASIVSLILLAWLWIGLIHDQMPCFLGVPHCD